MSDDVSMLGLSPKEQNAIMALRQNQQQIENKSINDIIDMIQRKQSSEAIQRRHEDNLNFRKHKFDYERKMDNIKNLFKLKETKIKQSKLNLDEKNYRLRKLAQRSLSDWQDAQIEYVKNVKGIKTEVFEDAPGVFKTYFVKGSKKIGEPIRTSNIKDLKNSNKKFAKDVYKIQKELDNITLNNDGKYIYPSIENLKRIRNIAQESGKDITVLEIPGVLGKPGGIFGRWGGKDPLRIPFIIDSPDENVSATRILDILVNKYGMSEEEANEAIDRLLEVDKEHQTVNFGE